jgi:hypothetical protein
MAKSTKFKKGDYAVQLNCPGENSLVRILEQTSDPSGVELYRHEHVNLPNLGYSSQMGVVSSKYLRKATKKELLIHAVRKEY